MRARKPSTKNHALELLPNSNDGAPESHHQAQSRPSTLAVVAPVDSEVEQIQTVSNDNETAPENETISPPKKNKKKKKTDTNIPVPPVPTAPNSSNHNATVLTVVEFAKKFAAAENVPLSPSHIVTATDRFENLRLAFITAREERIALTAQEKEKNICTAPPRPPYRYEVSKWTEEQVTAGPVAPKDWTEEALDLDGLCCKTLAEYEARIQRNKEDGWEGEGGVKAVAAARVEAMISASNAPPAGAPPPGFAPDEVARRDARGKLVVAGDKQSSTAPPPSSGFKVPPSSKEKPEPIMSDRPPAPSHPALPWRTTILAQKPPIWTVTIHALYPKARAVRIGECAELHQAMGFYAKYKAELADREVGVYDPGFMAGEKSRPAMNTVPSSKAAGEEEKGRDGNARPKFKGRVTGRVQTKEWDGLKEVARRIGRDMEAGFDLVLRKVGRDGEVEGGSGNERVVMRCWVEKMGRCIEGDLEKNKMDGEEA